jgi:hypothetical protein
VIAANYAFALGAGLHLIAQSTDYSIAEDILERFYSVMDQTRMSATDALTELKAVLRDAPEFDWKKPLTLTGTVTKVEWTNPHARVTIDVQSAGGNTTSWALELGSPRERQCFGPWWQNQRGRMASQEWAERTERQKRHFAGWSRAFCRIGVFRPSWKVR